MHVPDSMLSGAVCPVTAAVSTLSLTGAIVAALKIKTRPVISRFAAVTALIFAVQMLNFPVSNGTSGHLLGGVLAAVMLGTPFGMLSMALVVSIQALFFADGGLTVLGANLLNMSVIGAGAGGLMYSLIAAKLKSKNAAVFAAAGAAWLSVVIAAAAVCVELASAGTISLSRCLPAMLSVHAVIGIGEAVITAAAVYLFGRNIETDQSYGIRVAAPVVTAFICALAISPFASAYPDGLEYVAQRLNFLRESAPAFVSPFSDYLVPALGESSLSTGLSGVIGVVISLAGAIVLGSLITAGSRLLTTE
ncbi:energy-coupling factor ABC transporter permease [Lentisphaerota bacterium ZTH]|nr:energy-coupling factor ABC transporter permease [Lentisphaerota bacterium]WET06159.1 energy-coupling factor ABC transporter permease [Lentisphaerota bacterium ZTH]